MSNKIKSIHQTNTPNMKRLKSIIPVTDQGSKRNFRPARKISDLIKRGLVEGVRASDDLGDSYWDEKEGRCPSALRVDVDKFDVATKMMRNGDSQKAVTSALLEVEF